MQTPPAFLRRARWTRLAAAIVIAFAATPSHAQSERIAELERKLEQTLQQLDKLTQRIQQVESGAAARAAATGAAAPPELAAKVQQLEQEVGAMATRPGDDHGLALHGFADVGLAGGSKGRKVGGNVGSLDFYLTPAFGDRVKSLLELNFEVGTEGSVAGDLERLQVGYTVADELTVWLGRFHTPLGYWNTAFHHGAQIQSSILRPMFLDFEDRGGILPAHTVGLWGTGAAKLAGGRLGYDVYAGNAPTITGADASSPGSAALDPGLNGAAHRSATFGANLNYGFGGALQGLTLGAHALTSKVADSLATPNETRLGVYGGWLSYLEHDWEVLGEWYSFRNRDLSGPSGTHTSQAGYLQVGRTLGSLTPFARYERASFDQSDNYFAQLQGGQSYKRVALGARYEMNPAVALKLEATRTSLTDRETGSYSEVRAQWAVRF